MNILITGANGFVGRNLVMSLENISDGKDKTYKLTGALNLFQYDVETDTSLLEHYCRSADFVVHLAGINRPKEQTEFMEGNFGLLSQLLENLKKYENTCPVLLSSSIQATLDNPYGLSKKAAEELLFTYGRQTGAKVLVYRFPNIFGKWCRPNYNSVVATFCHNIASGLPITVNDRNTVLELVYIDDVVHELVRALTGEETQTGDFCSVPVVHTVTLGEIANLLIAFKDSRTSLFVPDMSDGFTKKLYSTYLSYLPEDRFGYPLQMNTDARGSFTEFLRTPERGQVSVNITKPGVIKGNHWHHTKNEKFLVVSGRGVIRFRQVNSKESLEYVVSGDRLEAVDIPVGYTHSIQNLGDTDLVTIMWANEPFDPQKPDTYYLEV